MYEPIGRYGERGNGCDIRGGVRGGGTRQIVQSWFPPPISLPPSLMITRTLGGGAIGACRVFFFLPFLFLFLFLFFSFFFFWLSGGWGCGRVDDLEVAGPYELCVLYSPVSGGSASAAPAATLRPCVIWKGPRDLKGDRGMSVTRVKPTRLSSQAPKAFFGPKSGEPCLDVTHPPPMDLVSGYKMRFSSFQSTDRMIHCPNPLGHLVTREAESVAWPVCRRKGKLQTFSL